MNLTVPLRFDHRGRTAECGHEQYVRELIEAVLFTAPGERVMRPDFGSGLLQLVFGPASTELAGATQMLVHGALTQWLSDLIAVQQVDVTAGDGTIRVTVAYTVHGDDAPRVASFERGGPA